MEFEIGNGVTLMLPSIQIMILSIICIVLLIRWSKEVETGRYKVFLYFLISSYITPVFTRSSEDGLFQLWMPLGFIAVLLYWPFGKNKHSAKMKASLLGFCIALFQLVSRYSGWFGL